MSGEIERHKLALQFAPICAAGAPALFALFALFLTKTNITLALGVGEREGEKEREGKRGANDDNSGTLHELATSTLS